MTRLRRFWFQFSRSIELPSGVRIGCGVSAFDRTDAMALLQDRVFTGLRAPEPVSVFEDVDVSSLDPGHVLPNMGNPAVRGVWFPLGY